MTPMRPVDDLPALLVNGIRQYALFLTDPNGRVVSWNTGARHLTGYGEDQILGRSVGCLYPRGDDELASEMALALQAGEHSSQGWRVRQNGTRFWADALVAAVYDAPGGLRGFAHVVCDATERHFVEMALRESAERFGAIFEQASVAITQATLDGRWLHFNDQLCRITGYTRDELSRVSFHEITHPDDRQITRELAERLIAGEINTYSLEKRYIRRDGRSVWVSLSASLVREDDGRPRYLISVIQDIDWRRQAEEELRSVLTYARCILWRADIESRPGWDQPGADASFFRWHIRIQDEQAAQQVIPLDVPAGVPYVDVWMRSRHAEDVTRMNVTSIRALVHGAPFYSQEFRLLDRHGQVHWLHEDVSIRQVAPGRWHAFAVVTDVTERRNAEEQRTDLLHREQQARAEAEAANRRKDQFLAVLSHELRTPLTPVMARLDLLSRQSDLSSAVRASIQSIQRNVQLEINLINDLLDLTHITRGTLELRRQTVNVHQVILNALDIFQPQVDGRRLSVTLDLRADPAMVHADPVRLQQVFWNLISNAVKFTPPDGQLSIRSERRGGELEVVFSDTGIGIAPELMSRIFDPFEQGEQTITRRYGGLGLGLSISRTLVQMHGGTISASSDGTNRGASFTVRLPLIQAVPAAAQGAAPSAPSRGRPLRLLLVEDNPDTRQVMTHALRKLGHTVLAADSVRQALDLAREYAPDLLVCDIGLPDGTGWDLMRQLRTTFNLRGIALSGFGQEEDVQKSREAGFDQHLVKPVNLQQLESALAQVAA